MGQRVLYVRVTLVALGAGCLITGVAAGSVRLLAAGLALALGGEALGLWQLRRRFPTPAPRLLRVGAECLPAVGVAALNPAALGVAVCVAAYAVMAAGLDTVCVSRGLALGRVRGESLRRALTALSNVALLVLPGALVLGKPLEDLTGADERQWVWMAVALAGLASLRALVDLWLTMRDANARNVDR